MTKEALNTVRSSTTPTAIPLENSVERKKQKQMAVIVYIRRNTSTNDGSLWLSTAKLPEPFLVRKQLT